MSPLQTAAPFLPVMATSVALAVSTAKVPVCRRSGAHSSLVRPYPATRSSSPATGAVALRATGVMPVTGLASFASTRSWSGWGTRSTTSRTCPVVVVRSVRPMVAVVLSAGAPAGTSRLTAGSSAKQLAAVSSQSENTSVPEQARWPLPMSSRAVKA